MRYCDLQPGDVVMKGEQPIWVVLECSPSENKFRWLDLMTATVGGIYDPNMEISKLWEARLMTEQTILRDGKTISWKPESDKPSET